MRLLILFWSLVMGWGMSPVLVLGQEIFQGEDGLFSTRPLVARAPMGPDNRLLIRSAVHLSGKISIEVTEENRVTVHYIKQAKTADRSKAVDYIDLISVSLDLLPEETRLDLRAPNPAPWDAQSESGRIDVEVTVPIDCSVEIDATYFDVNARGPLRGLMVPSSLGRLEVANVTELLELSTANRRIDLSEISGRISVSTTNSAIIARSIDSKKTTAKFRNDGGDIKIGGFRGAINVRNQFGRISIADFEPSDATNFIRCLSGPIDIEISEMSSGQLVVNNRHEDIEIVIPENLQAFLSLAVSDEGLIEARGFPFSTDFVQNNRLNLFSGDGRAEISGSVRGQGNIYITGVEVD